MTALKGKTARVGSLSGDAFSRPPGKEPRVHSDVKLFKYTHTRVCVSGENGFAMCHLRPSAGLVVLQLLSRGLLRPKVSKGGLEGPERAQVEVQTARRRLGWRRRRGKVHEQTLEHFIWWFTLPDILWQLEI